MGVTCLTREEFHSKHVHNHARTTKTVTQRCYRCTVLPTLDLVGHPGTLGVFSAGNTGNVCIRERVKLKDTSFKSMVTTVLILALLIYTQSHLT